MEIKTSTVKSVAGDGTHEDKFGLKYDFEVAMENGDVGQYSSQSKEQTKFEKGKEVTYEKHIYKTSKGEFVKIKPHYPKKTGQQSQQSVAKDDVQLYIIRQSSLKIALDFHNITMDDPKKLTREDVAETSEFFTNYVMNGLGKVTRIEAVPESPPPPTESDLPF